MQCPHCHSLFFKTLEVRISKISDLLYKKRCKRCKHKSLFRKDLLDGSFGPLSVTDWQAGTKVGPDGCRARIFVSEYTRKISQAGDRQSAYLQQIQRVEGLSHEPAKTVG